jgi:hypothetical protein
LKNRESGFGDGLGAELFVTFGFRKNLGRE